MNITFKFIQTIFSVVQEVVTKVEQMCSLSIFIDIVIFHVLHSACDWFIECCLTHQQEFTFHSYGGNTIAEKGLHIRPMLDSYGQCIVIVPHMILNVVLSSYLKDYLFASVASCTEDLF